MNNKLKPALIGGVLLGLLSAIPVVNLVNVCCCLWALIGGLLASYLYIKNSPVPASAGDGAILGALAGLVGAVIVVVIGIPISIIAGGITRELLIRLIENVNPGQAEAIRIQMEASSTIPGAIVNGIILAVLLVIFSTIGGLLGVPIFEKRKGSIPPPPPQM
jgi:CDP-diglyceride synthetase